MGMATLVPTLPQRDMENLYVWLAAGVDYHRQRGYATIANWFDAVGAVLALEAERREANAPIVWQQPAYTHLQQATEALATEDLRSVGRAIYVTLAGASVCPWADFMHEMIGLLHTVGLARERAV